MIKFTEIQTNILSELAKFKFLTTSQLHRLGVGKDIPYIRRLAGEMSEGDKTALLGKMVFGVHPKLGRIENVYYLTKRGAEFCTDDLRLEPEAVKHPIGKSTLFEKDYFHRKSTIDFQIHLSKWTETKGFTVDFFDTYFDKIGSNRRDGTSESKTKVALEEDKYLMTDGIFQVSTPSNKFLFLFELYNGRDTLRVLNQLKKHVKAIELGTPSQKYSFPKGHRVVAVFEFETAKKAVIDRVRQDDYFSNMAKRFLFKSAEELGKLPFGEQWGLLSGEQTPFLPIT